MGSREVIIQSHISFMRSVAFSLFSSSVPAVAGVSPSINLGDMTGVTSERNEGK
jgi:hypothetical protein